MGLVLLAWGWPASSEACSCEGGSPELATNLREARQGSAAIYYGRVLSVEERPFGGKASVEVLEVFKGKLEVGTKLQLPTGGGGDCSIPFEAGQHYLMYANDTPESVWLCSRTRPASRDDAELEWLRTGKLPVIPVAVQREAVTCQPCSLETVSRTLVGAAAGDACSVPLRAAPALAAFREVRPFWSHGVYDPNNSGQAQAVGLSSTLRAFELTQTPYRDTLETCRQRVLRRWCEGLEPSGADAAHGPALRCVNPGPEEEVCNEEKSRSASWGPLQAMSAASCHWYDLESSLCKMSQETKPLAKGAPRAPLLRCSPVFDRRKDHLCHVVRK
ncbi:hypothetical protein [Hyalangium gracile]|uniref:hypothetical protein n=1 Tax=Hyalangium gracile TaxID=394092 RepID=UPI001CCFC7E0|nr:hypothetical protein [Hyalangium gracile]